MSTYLIEAIHNVIESHIERFFMILKNSAQHIELIDSLVAPMKNGKLYYYVMYSLIHSTLRCMQWRKTSSSSFAV